MPDVSVFCPSCGKPLGPAKPTLGTTGGIRDNFAGALACFVIPAIVLLLRDPFRRNRFIRFHSFQAIFLVAALMVLGIVLRIVAVVLLVIPVIGHLLVLLIPMIGLLGVAILWLILLVKALQGEMFRLPFIGDLAEKQAGLALKPPVAT
jgi:uncharacterized membrane protein